MPRRDRHDTQRVATDRVAADILRALRRCGVARNHADRYDPTDRRYAELLDASDPLASLLDTFDREWAAGLVGSWESWIELPLRIGDALAHHLLGARPGEVVVGDSTTVYLYKAASAAIRATRATTTGGTGRGARALVTDDDNFPTDRYVLEGLAAHHGIDYRGGAQRPDPRSRPRRLAAHLDGAAPLCLSHVAYRSGAVADMADLTWLAHDHGALTLWDPPHSVGAVPVDLTGSGADLAVGCTYKYLNGGPGAPAFCYVRRELQGQLRQPIWGWFASATSSPWARATTRAGSHRLADRLAGIPRPAARTRHGDLAVQQPAHFLPFAPGPPAGRVRCPGRSWTPYSFARPQRLRSRLRGLGTHPSSRRQGDPFCADATAPIGRLRSSSYQVSTMTEVPEQTLDRVGRLVLARTSQ
jgi:hypothetical protein